jgi:3-hydroxyacyl-CoA dehydrogenase
MKSFKKVCVIGAGVMGQGIAAHLANARIPVVLLDMTAELAKKGKESALKAKPALFFTPEDAALVETGSLETDLQKAADCDWVVEVIVERMDAKQKLFERLEPIVGPTAVVTSNTSGLSIEGMTQGRSAGFKQRFLVTHFFNPVRYMPLLEIVAGKDSDRAVVDRMAKFGERVLGKTIVFGKDTPNFVANRVGVFGMMETMRAMVEGDYTLEEVDAVFGPPSGRAKSAVFGTADVVGLDTFVHVAQNCWDNLPKDERHDVFAAPAFLQKMVENKWLGRKSGQGFYKKEGAEIVTLDWKTMTYRPKQKVRYDSLGAVRNLETTQEKVKLLAYADDKAGKLFWNVSMATGVYAANRIGEIADSIVAIDDAMRAGFMWELGPFETWDAIGVVDSVAKWQAEGKAVPAWVEKMLALGRHSFYRVDDKGHRWAWDPKHHVEKKIDEPATLTLLKKDPTRVVKDAFATTLVDLGDGVLGCEFHTKMNAIDGDVIAGINEGIDLCEEGRFTSLVIANEGANFSVGANLLLLYLAAQQQEWGQIDGIVRAFQDVCVRMKYSTIPVVAAPHQMALGGGAEVCLWANRIRAHAETYMGLVEVGVGLIPGGGGNIEMLARTLEGAVDDPTFPTEPLIRRALEAVAMAKVATSAEEARGFMMLSKADGVTLNRRLHLEAAKQEASGMAKAGFVPPRRRTFRLPGRSAYATFEMALSSMKDGHFISDHDLKIAMKVAHVMTGGDCTPRAKVSEQYLLDLEREAFLSLCGEEKTQQRISYMLENNKPLRN